MTINAKLLPIPDRISPAVCLLLLLLSVPNLLAAQDCGNDTEPPVFQFDDPYLLAFSDGDTIYYQCGDQQVFQEEQVSLTDNCDPEPDLSFSKSLTTGNCAADGFMFTVDYCWTASDDSGNTDEFCLTIVINDTVLPTLIGIPADLTVDLTEGDTIPAPASVMGFDECHGYLPVELSETIVPDADSCGFTLMRMWETTDHCGNSSQFLQQIFVMEPCPQQQPCISLPFDLQVSNLSDCNAKARICLDYPLGQALLYDITLNGQAYEEPLEICGYDTIISYGFFALPGNGMDGPYEIQSWILDGQSYGGTFDDLNELTDLFNMLDPYGSWVLDMSTLSITSYYTGRDYGPLTIYHPQTTDLAVLSLNSATAPVGSAIYLPEGVYQVGLKHQDFSFCTDTFTAVVHCPAISFAYDSLEVTTSNRFCTNPETLPGKMDSLFVSCENCDHIETAVDGDCIEYEGKTPGQDTVLIIACDEYGICDSTRLVITVFEKNRLPLARDDHETAGENAELIIHALSNDDINGQLVYFGVLLPPAHGSIKTDAGLNFIYRPDQDYCGPDGFVYRLCNEHGCDTSAVTIDIACTRPVVHNGFSPNKDGINDHFRIDPIDRTIPNQLTVYNRWGSLVFRQSNYLNNWDGTDTSGHDLPEGTYYYLFETGNGELLKGYVQINR